MYICGKALLLSKRSRPDWIVQRLRSLWSAHIADCHDNHWIAACCNRLLSVCPSPKSLTHKEKSGVLRANLINELCVNVVWQMHCVIFLKQDCLGDEFYVCATWKMEKVVDAILKILLQDFVVFNVSYYIVYTFLGLFCTLKGLRTPLKLRFSLISKEIQKKYIS